MEWWSDGAVPAGAGCRLKVEGSQAASGAGAAGRGELSNPAQLRQVDSGAPIELFMGYTLRPSLTPAKVEVGDQRMRRTGGINDRKKMPPLQPSAWVT